MNSKLNVINIIRGHLKTFSNDEDRALKRDLLSFFIIPFIISVFASLFLEPVEHETTSLLVNFASIFTALLLSVLVLIYDQEVKLKNKNESTVTDILKQKLLKHLYFNISFSIIASVTLIAFCFIHSIIGPIKLSYKSTSFELQFISNIFILFITINLFLNIIMIVKRMHVLLTHD